MYTYIYQRESNRFKKVNDIQLKGKKNFFSYLFTCPDKVTHGRKKNVEELTINDCLFVTECERTLALEGMNETVAKCSQDGDGDLPYTIPEMVVIAILAGALSIATVLGNCMVMISFKIDKQLQTISNYFLFRYE